RRVPLLTRRPPRSPRFPYTTLFRSMVWSGGLLSADGPFAAIAAPVDFAGGTVVHINAGVAGLVLALVVGRRKGFGTEAMRPHNLDRKSTRLNSSHVSISYAVFCLKK